MRRGYSHQNPFHATIAPDEWMIYSSCVPLPSIHGMKRHLRSFSPQFVVDWAVVNHHIVFQTRHPHPPHFFLLGIHFAVKARAKPSSLRNLQSCNKNRRWGVDFSILLLVSSVDVVMSWCNTAPVPRFHYSTVHRDGCIARRGTE